MLNGYTIIEAAETDHEEVLRLSNSMDLDVKEFNIRDFCVIKKESHIVGFGRLRPYNGFQEVATVGIIENERNKGLGSAVVRCLLRERKSEVYLTCVIPGFFAKLGFSSVSDFPKELLEKYNFCRSFGYSESEVHVMKYRN